MSEGADGSLSLTSDNHSFAIHKASINEDWFTLEQGGYITNLDYFGNVIAVETVASSSSSYYSLQARASLYPISSPGNASYELLSGTSLSLNDGGPYFSIYAAIGSFSFSSIVLTLNNEKPANPTSNIDFYTMNDNHGAAERTTSQIGTARLSSYLKSEERANPEGSVVLSSGDLWQGSADSNLSTGGVMIDWTNLIGMESMAIGNHEFDWGLKTIATNAAKSNCPFLSINVRNKDGSYPSWCTPSKVISRQGIKIGIIGAIGKLETSIAASSLEGAYFESDYMSQVDVEAKRLRSEENCSLVVLSIHNGEVDTTDCTSIDAVFLGHVHKQLFRVDSNGIPHIRCDDNGEDIGHLTFTLGEDGKYHYSTSDYFLYGESASMDDDAEETRLYNYYQEVIGPIKNRVLGHSDTGYSQYDIGLLSCKAGREYYAKKLAPTNFIGYCTNKAGVRQAIPAGDITYGQIYGAFPFDNYNDLCEVKGSNLTLFSGSGFYFDFDQTLLNSIDQSATYTIVTNSYVSESQSYSSFLTLTTRDNYFIRDILSDYLEANL